MILNDTTIKLLLETGQLVIEPLADPDDQIQPASVDLRLLPEVVSFVFTERHALSHKRHIEQDLRKKYFNVRRPGWVEHTYLDPRNINSGRTVGVTFTEEKPLILMPGEFILGSTVERVQIPNNLVGRCEGKSSLGRLGLLIHATAGFIDPGFHGQITLEITNVAPLPIILWPEMKICQLALESMTGEAERPYGHPSRNSKYQGQMGATLSRMGLDNQPLTNP